MGDFEAAGGVELAHQTFGHAEAFHAGGFFAAFKQELVAEADAEVGLFRLQPGLQGLPEAGFLEDADGVAKRALAGENQDIDGLEVFRLGD